MSLKYVAQHSALMEEVMAAARAKVDHVKIEELSRSQLSGSERKYLDTEYWLLRKLDIWLAFDFHNAPPMEILDLGTGPGHFVFIANHFGHSARGLDQPGYAIYDGICDALGVPKADWRILAGEPLPPSDSRYDLITAFMIGFNTKADGTLFTVEDWGFFLDDVRDNQLRLGGRLLLKMIRQEERVGLKYGDAPLMDYFASRGARFLDKGRYVDFDGLV